MQNVHAKAPVLFQTRWAMNFLAGPLTRTQIPALNQLAGAEGVFLCPMTGQFSQPAAAQVMQPGHSGRGSGAASIGGEAGFLHCGTAPPNLPRQQASMNTFCLKITACRKRSRRQEKQPRRMPPSKESSTGRCCWPPRRCASWTGSTAWTASVLQSALVSSPERRGSQRWEEFPYRGPGLDKVETSASGPARFDDIESPLNDSKMMAALQKDFADWVFRSCSVTARANENLKVYAGPDVSAADFMKACADTAREARDDEVAKRTAVLDRQIKTLQEKLGREERELRQDEADLKNRNIESAANVLEIGASLFGLGRKKSISTVFTKNRLSQNAKEDVQESKESIEQYEKQLAELQQSRQQVLDEVQAQWSDVVNKITEVKISPKKTDIYVNLFGLAWMPYYQVKAGGQVIEVPAFGAE